jgi:hypothetical protein
MRIWSPYRVNQVKLIKSVQRKVPKRLAGYASLSYKDRLLRLGQLSWIEAPAYDLLLSANNMFTLISSLHSHSTRGHAFKLYPHNSRIDIRKYFFSERVVALWNNLPATDDHFCSLSFFKRLIVNWLINIYVVLPTR